MADRVEKLSVKRTPGAVLVTVALLEGGINVSYAVKTYETQVKDAVQTARKGAERLLNDANA